jgi:hypothetical protein
VPAAAVIPAPIAYIKVVAVKKLVVGYRDSLCNSRVEANNLVLLAFAVCGGESCYALWGKRVLGGLCRRGPFIFLEDDLHP